MSVERILREPLLHFLLIGLALFLYTDTSRKAAVTSAASSSARPRSICLAASFKRPGIVRRLRRNCPVSSTAISATKSFTARARRSVWTATTPSSSGVFARNYAASNVLVIVGADTIAGRWLYCAAQSFD